MMQFSNSQTHWGKLTSLDPNYQNISLSKNPSIFHVNGGRFQVFIDRKECQISHNRKDCFIAYTGSNISVQIEDRILKENEAFKICSGERIMIIRKKGSHKAVRIEYVFSTEAVEKNGVTRAQEKNVEILKCEKILKFSQDLENSLTCKICKKMLYECVLVFPCLHRFCINCLMKHLKNSQNCPECGKKFLEFCKDPFLNNLISAYGNRDFSKGHTNERQFARFEYTNGDIYEGEWKDCKKDGQGKMIFSNGRIYEGEWKDDKIEGNGRMIFHNGDIYEGGWRDGVEEGRGKMISHDGEIYDGDLKEGKREGKGKMLYKGGQFYEGEFHYDKMEGKGKMVYPDGKIYDGDWKGHHREGKGKMLYKDGRIYIGDWKCSKREGRGKMIGTNGCFYEGYWANNETELQGKVIFPSGNVYEGHLKNNLMQGKGKMLYKNGDFYEGRWKNNEKEGKGKMVYGNGEVYEGQWKNGGKVTVDVSGNVSVGERRGRGRPRKSLIEVKN